MITKTSGFLSKIGNIFKSEAEALDENRRDVLCKYLLKDKTDYDWCNDRCTTKTYVVADNKAVENFIKYYDDVMRQLKEVDKNVT